MRTPAALVTLLAMALSACAQEKIEIRSNVKKGLKFTKEQTFEGEGDCKLGGGEGGISLTFKVKLSGETKQVEEIKEAKNGMPVESRRQYPKRSSDVDMAMFGKQEDLAHPLEGAELTFGPSGKTAIGPEGAVPASALAGEEAADHLTMMVASGKAVSAGNTWDADPERVKAWLTSEVPGLKAQEAEVSVKLAEFRDKDGQKCVRLEIDGKAKGTFSTGKGPESPAELTITGDIFYGIDAGMVISLKAKGEMKGTLPINTGGGEGNLEVKVPFQLKSSVKTGTAEFGAKPTEKPKPKKPEWYPPPVR